MKETEDWLDVFEELLRVENYYEVNVLLSEFNTDRLGSATIVAIASITFHGKTPLDHGWDGPSPRQRFLDRAELTLSDRFGVERAKALLENRR